MKLLGIVGLLIILISYIAQGLDILKKRSIKNLDNKYFYWKFFGYIVFSIHLYCDKDVGIDTLIPGLLTILIVYVIFSEIVLRLF